MGGDCRECMDTPCTCWTAFHEPQPPASMFGLLQALANGEATVAETQSAIAKLPSKPGWWTGCEDSDGNPVFTGRLTDRFIDPLKFARYYIVEALEVQEQSDLRDALVTLDWLIDGDADVVRE